MHILPDHSFKYHRNNAIPIKLYFHIAHIHTNSYICIYEAEELKGNYDHDPINYLSDLKHLKAYSKENSLILYEFTF